ncbi:hypothetical protein Acr_22g0000390 [Actinidia rufa]|uniref:Uncharacterized protein n=1 Tax=Actinidia rufa TaxID=165716 RepID=A0A7J0GIT0_9ERIC|nr:hypothetical protein Acr_22g0000390 [Actinidia rufa]
MGTRDARLTREVIGYALVKMVGVVMAVEGRGRDWVIVKVRDGLLVAERWDGLGDPGGAVESLLWALRLYVYWKIKVGVLRN